MLYLPENVLAWSELKCQAGVDQFCGYVWQPVQHAAVLGISQSADKELNTQHIEMKGVKIIRRQSGGGAVILCDNVLCFGFFAPSGGIDNDLSIKESFRKLTEPVVRACKNKFSVNVVNAGISDLAVEHDGELKKICGCAQMRKRNAVLVHGTILVNADISLLEEYLAWPSEVPDYRKERSHSDFCINLSKVSKIKLTPELLAAAIRDEATAVGWDWLEVPHVPDEDVQELVHKKYGNFQWNIMRKRQ